MLRLYLDTNVYNRPFDNQRVPRNRIEAQVVLELLDKVEAGEVTLVSSFVLEHGLSPLTARRERVGVLIGLAQEHVYSDPRILGRARALERTGFKGRDALHLAAAEYARVDYFVTRDDKLIGRARQTDLSIRVVSPAGLLEEGVI